MKEISPYYFEISQTNEFQSSTEFQRLDLRNDVTIALEYGELLEFSFNPIYRLIAKNIIYAIGIN